jgi:GntR family transcriptional regulator, transcriptional repressor for pyruvate dehydrogenase complex
MYQKERILSSRVANILLKMIASNYQGGDRIPNEMDLSEKLRVSRTTIREAVKTLCAINVLEVRQGSGTYICQTPGLLNDPLGYRFIEKDKLRKDLYETRLTFEPEVAALAARKVTPDCIEKMRTALIQHNDDIERFKQEAIGKKELYKSDLEFHRSIAECCNNLVLERVMPIITHGLLGVYYGKIPFDISEKTRTHDLLFEAIAGKKAEEAKEIMRCHIMAAHKSFTD